MSLSTIDVSMPGEVRAPSAAISVAVDPVALVVTECITVTSAMRKHARWAHSSVAAILGAGTGSGKADVRRTPQAREAYSEKGGQRPRERAASFGEDVTLASRWGLRGKKGQSLQDNPLLSAFARLRSDLKRCRDIHTVDAPTILHPFLQVIRSSSTSAPITSLALIAITKFFAYNIISRESPQLPLGMQLLSSAVTHCRFEASDSATDEIVLFRILKLMEGMITGPGGEVLGDESMCEMMETGISMCCQVRLSELLRRSAEVSMITMCQTIFQRLKHLEVELEVEEPITRRHSSKGDADSVKMDPSINGDILSSNTKTMEPGRLSESLDIPRDKGGGGRDSVTISGSSQVDFSALSQEEESTGIKPYSLPSIRELFRVLVDLLDPDNRQHNDTMRVMALRIVDVALEVAGPSIASHPSLATLAKDTLCRHLFQLVRSENIAILNESLRVAGTLLSTCRRVLKLQQELFLSYLVACLHPRVEIPQEAGIDPALYEGVPQAPRLVKPAASAPSSGRSTPVPVKDRQKLGMEGGARKPDAREAMVESVGALVRIPSFMAELFVNYDCDVDRADLCLDMVGLLSRNAFPDAATWSTTNVPPLCLDALLGYIQSIADRLEDPSDPVDLPSRKLLQEQREKKKIIIMGAKKFNENPKGGIAYLVSQGIISNAEDPAAVASFLRTTTRVDKRGLGEFISKLSNLGLLNAWLDTFDFSNLRVDEALRQLLNSFRLPGESALIERIVSEFSAAYCNSNTPEDVVDKDALFVLTYAIIMLNTDQHNPNVKSQNRMTVTDFARNLRGVNGGNDFDMEFLEDIYASIKTKEIVLPEEHENKNSFDHAWKELQMKIQRNTDITICDTNMYDADMFAATWKPVIATLTYVFMSATDDTVFSRVVAGFDQCAQIAAKYKLHDALDHIVFCLSSVTALSQSTIPSTSLNTEVHASDKDIMVSETAVKFGRDFKAQLATVVLFRLVVGHESAIRDGWSHLISITLNLFVNSLITSSYSLLSSHTDLPAIPLQSPAQVIDRGARGADVGLFSAFTSYVSSFANDEPPEPSEQEIEYTLCTIDCVNACAFDTFFSNISRLPVEALKLFVDALLEKLPQNSTPQVIVVKPEMPAPTPIRANGQRAKPISLTYDPSLVFVLEFVTILVARDDSTMKAMGKEVADALQTVIRDAPHVHPVTLSRAVYYLLSFLRASHEHDFICAPVVLHAISKFDEALTKQCAPYMINGLSLCLNGPAGLRKEVVNTPDFWFVLKELHAVPETAQSVFDLLENIVDGSSSEITADNYEAVVALLNDYATAGSVGAAIEQRRDEAVRKGQPRAQKTKPDEVVTRGSKAIQIIVNITNRAPMLIQQSHLEPYEAWSTYWTPPLRTLTTHSINPCYQIRSESLKALSRLLLSPSVASSSSTSKSAAPKSSFQAYQTAMLFTDVLFPLLTQLLKPEVWHSDPARMGETRYQAAVLCCKVFLRYLDALLETPISMAVEEGVDATIEEPGIAIWAQILETLERFVKSGGGHADGLEEAVPESIKNILLVMASAGYIAPPSQTEIGSQDIEESDLQQRLWNVTLPRLERFLPGLLADVFPPPPPPKMEIEVESSVQGQVSAPQLNAEVPNDTTDMSGQEQARSAVV